MYRCSDIYQFVPLASDLVECGVNPSCLDGFQRGNGLHAACSSQAVPNHGLGAVHLHLAHVWEG